MHQSLRLLQKQYSLTRPYRPSRTLFLACARTFSTSTPSMDVSEDYYSLLGVSKAATQKQIRLAYFTLAKRHHPDLNVHKSKQEYEKST